MTRKSSVSALPPEARAWLEQALAADALTLDQLIAQLEQRWPEAAHPSRSAVHRYGQKLDRKLAAIRASTEAARLIAQAAPDQADLRSAAVISLVQSELFEAIVGWQEASDEGDPGERLKLLSGAARAIADSSRASLAQKKWQEEIAARLNALEKAQAKGGVTLDAATLNAVKQALYGG